MYGYGTRTCCDTCCGTSILLSAVVCGAAFSSASRHVATWLLRHHFYIYRRSASRHAREQMVVCTASAISADYRCRCRPWCRPLPLAQDHSCKAGTGKNAAICGTDHRLLANRELPNNPTSSSLGRRPLLCAKFCGMCQSTPSCNLFPTPLLDECKNVQKKVQI